MRAGSCCSGDSDELCRESALDRSATTQSRCQASRSSLPIPKADASQSESCCDEAPCCCSTDSASAGPTIALTNLAQDGCGIIRSLRGKHTDCAYLRALGFRPNMRVKLCRSKGTWIVEVGCQNGPCCRIGLARSLAQHIQVEPCTTQNT